MYVRHGSSFGESPMSFEYHRQYVMIGFTVPAGVALNVFVTSDVLPPSTSFWPGGSVGTALPVNQHLLPVGVCWTPGWATVSTGTSRTHCPDVALSPVAP